MKRTLGSLLVLLLTFSLLTACSGDSNDAAPVGTPDGVASSTADSVLLAVVQSLSGPADVYGRSALEGIELAIKELNATPGPHIEYTIHDDQSTPREGAAFYRAAVQNKVTAVVGPSLSNVGFEGLPIAQAGKTVAVSPITTASGIAEIGDYVFRVALAEEVSLPELVKFVATKTPLRQVVLFYDSSDAYNRSAAEAMRRGSAAVNATIALEVDLSTAPDLAVFTADPRVRNADAFLLPMLIDRTGPLLRTLRDAGLNQPALGGEALATTDLVPLAGNAAEGMYVASTWHPDVSNALSRRFVSAYTSAYGHAPEHFAAESYAAVYLLLDAIKRADSTDPARIRDALASTKDFDTVLGRLSMSPAGDAVFTPVFQRFENGQLKIAQ